MSKIGQIFRKLHEIAEVSQKDVIFYVADKNIITKEVNINIDDLTDDQWKSLYSDFWEDIKGKTLAKGKDFRFYPMGRLHRSDKSNLYIDSHLHNRTWVPKLYEKFGIQKENTKVLRDYRYRCDKCQNGIR